jgi:hypothetical protein
MSGGDKRDEPYYGPARRRIAYALSALIAFLLIIDAFPIDYEPSPGIIIALLTTLGVMVGVEAIKGRLS